MSDATTSPGTVPQMPEESVGIRNTQPEPAIKSKRSHIEEKKQTGSEAAQQLFDTLGEIQHHVKIAIGSLKHDEKQERRFKRNFSEEKKDEFYNLYDRAQHQVEKQRYPDLVAAVFVRNDIDKDYLGFTSPEIGIGIAEHEGIGNEVTLKEKTQRAENHIWHVRNDLNVHLVSKKMDDGRTVWYIAKDPKDYDDWIKRSSNHAGIFIDAWDKKREEQKYMKEQTQKQKQEEQEIIITTEGQEVSE